MTTTKNPKLKNLKEFATAGMQRSTVIISTGESITIRAFSVKELKLLMMASTAENAQDVQTLNVLKQCIDQEIDLDAVPSHDVEKLYLELYKLSKGTAILPVSYTCGNEVDGSTCGENITVNLNLNNVQLVDECQREIKLTDNITIKLRIPTTTERDYFGEKQDPFNLVMRCITHVITPTDTLIVGEDITPEELTEVIEYMNSEVYATVISWSDTLPSLQLHMPIRCPKCKHEEVISLEGLNDFFL